MLCGARYEVICMVSTIEFLPAVYAAILGLFGAVILIVMSKALTKAQAVSDAYNLLGGLILGFLLYLSAVLPPPVDNISAFAYILAGMGGLTALEAFVAKYYTVGGTTPPSVASGPPR